MSLAEIHKKAKLVMIPSGFNSSSSTDNLYSVIPSNSDGDFNYAGTTNGTRVNKDGLIEIASSNQPRLDYDSSNPQNPHLLLEPESTNLIQHSEDFTNSTSWLVFAMTVTSDNITSPNGALTSAKVEATGNGSIRTQPSFTVSNGYSFSIFVKKGNSRYVTLRSFAFTTSLIIGFDLDTVTAQTGGVIEPYPNDWYRLSISKDVSSDADKNGFFYIYLPDSLGSASSVSGNFAYFFGAQLEDLTYTTSYISTSGSATTRTVDTCNSAGNSTIINTSEGVLFAEIAALANDSSLRDISVSNGSTDRILLSYLNSSNRIAMQFIDGGASQFTLQFDGATITNFNKIAIKYKSSDYALWVNGSERATNTSHTNALAGLDRINFDRGDGGDDFFGKCKQLMYFDTILTDAELITLTT